MIAICSLSDQGFWPHQRARLRNSILTNKTYKFALPIHICPAILLTLTRSKLHLKRLASLTEFYFANDAAIEKLINLEFGPNAGMLLSPTGPLFLLSPVVVPISGFNIWPELAERSMRG
jgi:hypothetical protein